MKPVTALNLIYEFMQTNSLMFVADGLIFTDSALVAFVRSNTADISDKGLLIWRVLINYDTRDGSVDEARLNRPREAKVVQGNFEMYQDTLHNPVAWRTIRLMMSLKSIMKKAYVTSKSVSASRFVHDFAADYYGVTGSFIPDDERLQLFDAMMACSLTEYPDLNRVLLPAEPDLQCCVCSKLASDHPKDWRHSHNGKRPMMRILCDGTLVATSTDDFADVSRDDDDDA